MSRSWISGKFWLSLCVATAVPASVGMAQVISVAPQPTPYDQEAVEESPIEPDDWDLDLGDAPAAIEIDEQADTASDASEDVGPVTEVIRERYPNRAVKVRREVTQDAEKNYVNHGAWTMWTPAGDLLAEGRFEHGQRVGTWTLVRQARDAKLFSAAPYSSFEQPFFSQATFDAGRLHGKWTIYDAKQRKISEWEYQDGARHGNSVWWYPTGRKMQEATYTDGVIDGEFLQWNIKGEQVTRNAYDKGRKLAKAVTHHKGGKQVRTTGVYLHAAMTVKDAADWWSTQPETFETIGKDERHGTWVSWYPNGQKQLEGNYEHDLQDGQFTWWFENGQKQAEGKYVQGKMEGEFTWWHPNGQKQRQGEFRAGIPVGEGIAWSTDGQVVAREDYSHGGVHLNQPSVASDEDNTDDNTTSRLRSTIQPRR